MYKKIQVKKIDLLKGKSNMDLSVVDEVHIRIFLNGRKIAMFPASPNILKELAIGHLIGSGLIKGPDDIESIEIKDNLIDVKASNLDKDAYELLITEEGFVEKDIFLDPCAIEGVRTNLVWFARFIKEKATVDSNLKIKADLLCRAMKELHESSKTWKLTHGTHSAALFLKNGKKIAFAEDINRHAAVDKVIGISSLKKIDFSNSFLLSAGRVPASTVLKIAYVNIPIIVSRTAPINPSIEIARQAGITVVCFLKGKSMLVCCHEERIIV